MIPLERVRSAGRATPGTVYLVGAGPGDPDLLTAKALRLLRTADAVLHDDLVSHEVLHLISASAQVLNVGKRCGEKKISQEEVNFLMITLAGTGMNVVRLKSGDPLIFGRAGEEIAALRRAGIVYEVVPGVTSALGAAAQAHIPLTHRAASSALVFITAHQAAGSDPADWNKLAGGGATLVIYMPGRDSSEIAEKLKAAGLSEETPCALISRATTPQQQAWVTTLSDLSKAPHLAAPSLLIVGEVVRFAETADENEFSLPSVSEHRGGELLTALFAAFPGAMAGAASAEEPIV
jgi:uroporphyrin-III C-methyltransferase